MSRFRLAVLAAAAVIASFVGAAAQAAPAMWRVTSPTSELYLFRTLHALQPATRWRTAAYDAAYAKASIVWVEAHIAPVDPPPAALILHPYGRAPDPRPRHTPPPPPPPHP